MILRVNEIKSTLINCTDSVSALLLLGKHVMSVCLSLRDHMAVGFGSFCRMDWSLVAQVGLNSQI